MMAPAPPRLRILSVGGNAVSAFLSWRLQATNACDVTLVWKANYQAVAQYGISFKSKLFGNERFKPRYVVQNPEDASTREAAFDYVLLCVKALPDVYNIADIIQTVVTPQHTCILVNTTNTLGVEKHLEERFPTNVVLSLVSRADLTQLGASEFEHTGSTEIWVGPATENPAIPQAIQRDMSEALAMTLTTGNVECKVSNNIQQQQFERMIGPIAFHPVSVIFETPSHADLLEKPGVREMISDVIDELLQIARASDCTYPPEFKEETMQTMLLPTPEPSTMYQDYTSQRPMEVETYLGTPSIMAKAANVLTPRIDTLYTILRHINTINKDRPAVSPANPPPHLRTSSAAPMPPRGVNGAGRGMPMRPPPMGGQFPPGRRPPPPNGYRGPPNSYPPRGPNQMARRPSFEDNNLDEFSHVVLYDEMPEGDVTTMIGNGPMNGAVSLRERELALREKELALREHEMAMSRRGGRRGPPPRGRDFDDDDDDDDFFDPMRGPAPPQIDPDNFDMMSVTSRRTKKAPSQSQLRRNMFEGRGGQYGRPPPASRSSRASAQILADMPMIGSNIMDNPMMGFASNRYASVDRKELDESRTTSLTASRLQEMGGHSGGPYPPPVARRSSRSPGNPFGPSGRHPNQPSPPNDAYAQGPPMRNGMPNGMPNDAYAQGPPMRNGMPPLAMQAPQARYPPGPPHLAHPQQVEQQVGVSKPFPPPKGPTKSLTGSASASAGSGDSGSHNIESEPSAHSSTSSFVPRPMVAMH